MTDVDTLVKLYGMVEGTRKGKQQRRWINALSELLLVRGVSDKGARGMNFDFLQWSHFMVKLKVERGTLMSVNKST